MPEASCSDEFGARSWPPWYGRVKRWNPAPHETRFQAGRPRPLVMPGAGVHETGSRFRDSFCPGQARIRPMGEKRRGKIEETEKRVSLISSLALLT
ncbi:MAG: hypothetical protein CMJ29_04990 [Phycisphaerae bacterium]|nr:hypothetical protein [Phycisphaerae bacterium]